MKKSAREKLEILGGLLLFAALLFPAKWSSDWVVKKSQENLVYNYSVGERCAGWEDYREKALLTKDFFYCNIKK